MRVAPPVGDAGDEGPDLRGPQVALDAVPLRRRLVPGASMRDSSAALTSSASVSGIRPTLSRVKSARESNSGSCGASYQMT